MLVEDQSQVLAFLGDAASWDGDGAVERIDTHAAAVFLCGDRAFKLKRAVRYDYMDYSTVERRRAMCEEEVRLNRRTAPDIYRGVRAVTRGSDGGLEFDGAGPAVDWVVDMRRFDQESLFDRLALRHQLTADLMRDLADVVARFHDAVAPRRDIGGADDVAATVDLNHRQFLRYAETVFEPAQVEALGRESRRALERHRALIDRRQASGCVRHCHGDLHLRNICLWEGRPTLFDAIEFNERFAVTDVVYDLAFLLMDLLHRGLRPLANVVLNRYMARRWDFAALALLPLYLSMRAAVRGHVSATMAETAADQSRAARLANEGRAYLAQAIALFDVPPPILVAVGGLSGSGKSTLARAVAPGIGAAPGAVVLRSDVTRKLLLGCNPESPLAPEAYTPEINGRVYDRLLEGARVALEARHSVVVDAVFADERERRAVEGVAREAGVGFVGLWLEAQPDVLLDRVSSRVADASDANAAVVLSQLEYDVGDMRWAKIAADGDIGEVRARAGEVLAAAGAN